MAYLADTLQLIAGYILPFLLVLTLLVFVHEMGHYLVGRWSGIRILAFSVGFGPELFGYTDKQGTRWKFCAHSPRRLCEILRRRGCRQRSRL